MKKLMKNSVAFFIIAALTLSHPSEALAASEYTQEDATSFTFSNSDVTAKNGDASNYEINGTNVTIQNSGTYIFDGSCKDGSVTVKKGTTGVILVLNGLTLENTTTAPITCNKSTSVSIVAAENSENTLTDASYNNDDNYPDNTSAENAVIKCKDGSKVTICGQGTLNINANGKNGIKSGATTDDEGEAYLIIEELSLHINAAVKDAINAEASLTIRSGNMTIAASDDAIHSDYALNIGTKNASGPAITINSSYEGLEAANLNIYSGSITIYSTDDCINAANSDLTGYNFSLDIMGGTLFMYTTAGDGIDSNGTLTISGGKVEVWSGNTADNQPLDADSTISITGGTVFAAGGSAGMGAAFSVTQPYLIYGSRNSMGGPGVNPGQPNQQTQSSSISKDSIVTVKDFSEHVIYTTTAPCNTGYVIFSEESLVSGNTYTLSSGNTGIGTATAQTTAYGSQNENHGANQPAPPSWDKNPPSSSVSNPGQTESSTNSSSSDSDEGTSNQEITTSPTSEGNASTGTPPEMPSGTMPASSSGIGQIADGAPGSESSSGSLSGATTTDGTDVVYDESNDSADLSSVQSDENTSSETASSTEENTTDAKITKPARTSIKKLKASKTSIKLTWKKVPDSDGYVVYRATKKGGSYKKIAAVKKITYTDSSLKKNTNYYYKVRTYQTAEDGSKIYGKYSSVKSGKTKK